MFTIKNILSSFKKQNLFLPFHLLLIIIFTCLFYFYAPHTGHEEDKKNFMSPFETFYYTTIVHFTIGFADITPKSKLLKIATMVHVFLTFLLFQL